MQILSTRVKEIRKNLRLTQAAFAEMAGICEEELSLIERGKARDVKLSTVQKIAAFTGLSVAELLNDTDSAEVESVPAGAIGGW